MHGGALTALADTCGAVCAFLNLPEGASGSGTIESKTNFTSAVLAGGVTAASRPRSLTSYTRIVSPGRIGVTRSVAAVRRARESGTGS